MYDELLLSMKNLIFISVFLLLPFHPGLGEVLAGIPHDFKMSVCEIVYVPENQGFDVKFYLFADDLKAAVYGNPEAAELATEVAVNYVLKHFSLTVNGRQHTPVFQSMREKNDQVLLHFTCPGISLRNLEQVNLKNNLLIEKFRDQVNMVYLVLPEHSKKTLMLNAAKTEGSFSLKS
jgi:hypothetical protein